MTFLCFCFLIVEHLLFRVRWKNRCTGLLARAQLYRMIYNNKLKVNPDKIALLAGSHSSLQGNDSQFPLNDQDCSLGKIWVQHYN